MKVYVAIYGEYSDTTIKGVFLDPEKAKLCALNCKWGPFHIEEFETADEKYVSSEEFDKKCKWKYLFKLFTDFAGNSEWCLYDRDPVILTGDLDEYKDDDQRVYVFLDKMDDEKAWKILHDRVAERKARKEGL